MPESDFNLKAYLEEKFKNVEEKFVHLEKRIDESNMNNHNELEKLRKNDIDHYNLDKQHRNICHEKSESLKDDMQDSLAKFGERVGRCEGKIEALKTDVKELKDRFMDRGNNFQGWVKSFLPYIMIVIYIVMEKMKGG